MKFSFAFALLLLSTFSRGQSLLVNGNFEDINTCTEYRVECAPEAWISSSNGFKNYFKDANRAHKSLNCMGIEAGHFQREYNRTFIRSRLLCGMRTGASYQLEFYIKSFHEVLDSVGVLFTATDPFFDKKPIHQLKPSFFLAPVIAPMNISDSNWHKVSVNFMATGEERFICFAYFAQEDFVGERAHQLENRYYVFLDDIWLVPLDPNEKPCKNWQEMKEGIYEENERHDLLEKKIKYYKVNPPQPPIITRNTYSRIDTLVLPDIFFASGKATLESSSHRILDSVSKRISNSGVDSIVVEGHTDSVGNYEYNARLSLDRANSVKSYLQSKSGSDAIITRGWAFTKPVADNRTPAGRQQNRRVEVILYIRE